MTLFPYLARGTLKMKKMLEPKNHIFSLLQPAGRQTRPLAKLQTGLIRKNTGPIPITRSKATPLRTSRLLTPEIPQKQDLSIIAPPHKKSQELNRDIIAMGSKKTISNPEKVMQLSERYSNYVDALQIQQGSAEDVNEKLLQELASTPLFSFTVFCAAEQPDIFLNGTKDNEQNGLDDIVPTSTSRKKVHQSSGPFAQYGLLGHEPRTLNATSGQIDPIFLNTNAPWSAFICGVQGSGKSHTLSCMLENCLLTPKKMKQFGELPKPLTGIVFHYDNNSFAGVCEAAYLSSAGIPVTVLVSPSNKVRLQEIYKKVPGGGGAIKIEPLKFLPEHLSAERMMKLMAFNDKEGTVPLYMEVIRKVLRDMVSKKPGPINFQSFESQLGQQGFSREQKGPMNMRLDLLKSFMDTTSNKKKNMFAATPGALTIVDLTDPFIDSATACVLFDICLSLFLESPTNSGRVVALDEGHKYLNSSSKSAADTFTESILKGIRLQRHIATRFIIATQEPTVSPRLLDLCSISIVHRFSSPSWFTTIRGHLGGASEHCVDTTDGDELRPHKSQIFKEIASLNVGEALLFAPAAALELKNAQIKRLGLGYIKFKTRPRVSTDGGKSKLAIGK